MSVGEKKEGGKNHNPDKNPQQIMNRTSTRFYKTLTRVSTKNPTASTIYIRVKG